MYMHTYIHIHICIHTYYIYTHIHTYIYVNASRLRLSELPVILVTGLERPEQRERGLAAGANEYIVKGSFEQSNLLEAIRRLCEES